MIEEFQSYIKKNNLFTRNSKLLLAVSGGVDSMVLLHLCQNISIYFEVAHINHGLRGSESDEDAAFVKSYCNQYGIIFHELILKKSEFAGKNIQLHARNRRYSWLLNLVYTLNLNYLVTAHHQDDDIETFFINLFRKGGIQSLSSINHQKNVVRPLLFANKNQIENYATINKIDFRHDASNDTDKYLRNSIRHNLIPLLNSIKPNAEASIAGSIKILKEENDLLIQLVKELSKFYIVVDGDLIKLDMESMKKTFSSPQFLYYTIKKYGFNFENSTEMWNSQKSSGSIWKNEHFIAIRNRQYIEVRRCLEEIIWSNILIDSYPYTLQAPFYRLIISKTLNETLENKIQGFYAYIPINAKILVRKVEQGDYFEPLGLLGKKQKVNKFLTDKKLSIFEKANILLIDVNDEIAVIIGFKTSQKFCNPYPNSELLFIKIDN